MDIARIVDYEARFPLDLWHPATGETLGVRFLIRSLESDAVRAVTLRHMDEASQLAIRGRSVEAATQVQWLAEKAAACVVSWDWGENKYRGETPEYSRKAAEAMFREQVWMRDDVLGAAANIANFIMPPQTV